MIDTILGWMELTSPWELVAVVLALAYLLLAVKRSLWCWACAFVNSAIYVVLMFDKKLYMQAALNIFYVAMAIYGFWEWRRGRDTRGEVAIVRWPLKAHVVAGIAVVVASGFNGWLLAAHSDAASPYVDAFVTWASVLTTWMVARRLIENWLYWVVVDSVAAYLYFQQGLRATALLFIVYVGIVIYGYFAWVRESRRSCTLAAET
jgi:nicotinamide mononucleotide transporter